MSDSTMTASAAVAAVRDDADRAQREEIINVASRAIERAKAQGATEADAYVSRAVEFEVKVADGAIVTLSQAGTKGLGLRVFVGGKLGFCTTSDFSRDGVQDAVQRAVALAHETEEDPNNGIANASEYSHAAEFSDVSNVSRVSGASDARTLSIGSCIPADPSGDPLRSSSPDSVHFRAQAAKVQGLTNAGSSTDSDRPALQNTDNDAELRLIQALDLYDPAVAALTPDEKIAWAHELERAARAADPRVRRFRDSGVSTTVSTSALVTSHGLQRQLRRTAISLWCNPIAEENGELQTEFWFDSRSHLGDLEAVVSVGRTAGIRAARMLGAKPIKTQRVPIIFEPQMTAGLMGGMLGALDGDMVHKKASFLSEKLGETIAASELTVVDDPLLSRGSASAPFDGEGVPTRRKAVINRGKLTTFLYDAYSARKAGKRTTGNARRGYATLPRVGAFNFLVASGRDDLADIVGDVPRALIVTRGLGRGVNTVSGDYSRGANGLWVENGEIVHPVQEVTIAGNFLHMLGNIDRIGNDFSLRGSRGAPTLRIGEMTVSGCH